MEEAAARPVRIALQYFDGCPGWRTTYDRLVDGLRLEGMESVVPTLVKVETVNDAERLQFVGSPTIVVNGRDPFAADEAEVGLTCRVYRTPDGLAGSPTIEQIRSALRA